MVGGNLRGKPISIDPSRYTGLCSRVYPSGERDLRGPLAKQRPDLELAEPAGDARAPGQTNNDGKLLLMDEQPPSGASLYLQLAEPAPAGSERGKTTITATKETVDADREAVLLELLVSS
jgi:hypothetical protein